MPLRLSMRSDSPVARDVFNAPRRRALAAHESDDCRISDIRTAHQLTRIAETQSDDDDRVAKAVRYIDRRIGGGAKLGRGESSEHRRPATTLRVTRQSRDVHVGSFAQEHSG